MDVQIPNQPPFEGFLSFYSSIVEHLLSLLLERTTSLALLAGGVRLGGQPVKWSVRRQAFSEADIVREGLLDRALPSLVHRVQQLARANLADYRYKFVLYLKETRAADGTVMRPVTGHNNRPAREILYIEQSDETEQPAAAQALITLLARREALMVIVDAATPENAWFAYSPAAASIALAHVKQATGRPDATFADFVQILPVSAGQAEVVDVMLNGEW